MLFLKFGLVAKEKKLFSIKISYTDASVRINILSWNYFSWNLSHEFQYKVVTSQTVEFASDQFSKRYKNAPKYDIFFYIHHL